MSKNINDSVHSHLMIDFNKVFNPLIEHLMTFYLIISLFFQISLPFSISVL